MFAVGEIFYPYIIGRKRPGFLSSLHFAKRCVESTSGLGVCLNHAYLHTKPRFCRCQYLIGAKLAGL